MARENIDIPEPYRPRIEDLPGDLRLLAESIERHLAGQGVRLTLLLAQEFGGQPVYLRKVDDLVARIRDDAIRARYDAGGITARELARETGLCLRQIERILARPASQAELKAKQGRLF